MKFSAHPPHEAVAAVDHLPAADLSVVGFSAVVAADLSVVGLSVVVAVTAAWTVGIPAVTAAAAQQLSVQYRPFSPALSLCPVLSLCPALSFCPVPSFCPALFASPNPSSEKSLHQTVYFPDSTANIFGNFQIWMSLIPVTMPV